MRLGGLELDELKQWIGEWLAANDERKLIIGLGKEEALRRARQLLDRIVTGQAAPADVELDEYLKEVLYALVYSILRAEPEHGRTIHEFIRAIPWTDDEFRREGRAFEGVRARGPTG